MSVKHVDVIPTCVCVYVSSFHLTCDLLTCLQEYGQVLLHVEFAAGRAVGVRGAVGGGE